MRRRSPGSAATRPASDSSARCFAMPCLVIGRAAAKSVAVAGPPEASAARMARRFGSAKAVNTASATDSDAWSGMEIRDQFVELAGPARGVALERLAVLGWLE